MRALAVWLTLWLALPAGALELPLPPTPTLDPAAATLDVQVQARIEEGRIELQEQLRWTLPVARGRVLLHGVVVPLLAPLGAAGNSVQERGLVPADGRALEVDEATTLRVVRDGDRLILAGTVEAGQPTVIRVRYTLPYRESTLRLGLSGHGAGQTWLAVAFAASAPARPRLELDRPGRRTRLEEGKQRLVGATLGQPLDRGAVASVTVADLPAPSRLAGRTLAWLAAGALACCLTLMAGRVREWEPAP